MDEIKTGEKYHTLILYGDDGKEVPGTEYTTLCHYGVKGMKWGVRRTPAQLGHKPAAGKAVKAAGNAARAVGDAARGLRTARQSRLVERAMRSNASQKDLRKALPYMTDADIQAKMSRQKLEQQMVTSNREHFQSMKQSGKAVKKGMDAGAGDAAKAGFGTFLKEASDPLIKAAGKTVGQGVLSGSASIAVHLAANKLGIDEKVAKEYAEIFKRSAMEDFMAVANTERSKFKEKNSLGETWEKAKADALSGKKNKSLKEVKEDVKDKVESAKETAESYASGTAKAAKTVKEKASKKAADREATAYRKGQEAAWKTAQEAMKARDRYFYEQGQYNAGVEAGRRAAEELRRRRGQSNS